MGRGDLGNPQRQVLTVPAAAKAKRVLPSCEGCQCFMAPPEKPEGVDVTAWQSAGKHMGRCVRFPQSVAKAPSDHCFEFLAREILPHA